MYAGKDFSEVDINETPVLTFNFAIYPLAAGETISSIVGWSCTVADYASVTDPSPSSRITGAPFISGTMALQQFGGWVAGVKYRVQALVLTSLGQDLNLYSFILAKDPALVT